MEFHRITCTDDPALGAFWHMYECSFPPEERRSREKQSAILSDSAYYCLAVMSPFAHGKPHDKENPAETGSTPAPVGLFCFWRFPEICYLEHLAVHPDHRSGGIGGKILQAWIKRYGDLAGLTVLEIDPPVTDIALRRKGFYERNGFVFNGGKTGLFMHPSYTKTPRYHPLCLMSLGRPMNEEDRRVFDDVTLRRVLKYDGPPYDGPEQVF